MSEKSWVVLVAGARNLSPTLAVTASGTDQRENISVEWLEKLFADLTHDILGLWQVCADNTDPDTEDDEDHHGGEGDDDQGQETQSHPGLGEDHGGVKILLSKPYVTI